MNMRLVPNGFIIFLIERVYTYYFVHRIIQVYVSLIVFGASLSYETLCSAAGHINPSYMTNSSTWIVFLRHWPIVTGRSRWGALRLWQYHVYMQKCLRTEHLSHDVRSGAVESGKLQHQGRRTHDITKIAFQYKSNRSLVISYLFCGQWSYMTFSMLCLCYWI